MLTFVLRIQLAQTTTVNRKQPAIAEKPNNAPAVKRSKKPADPVTPATTDNSEASATVASSWEVHPVLIPSNLVLSSDEDIAQMYRQHWPQIQTRISHHNPLQDWYNFHLSMISPPFLRENSATSLLTRPRLSKWISCLVLFCVTLKQELYGIIIYPPTTIWYLVKLIWTAGMNN